MGLYRVECVVVLTWTLLLLGSVQGWMEISNSQLKDILEGRYSVDTVQPAAPAKLPFKIEEDDDYDDSDYDHEDEDNEEDDYDDEEEEDPFYDNGEELDLKSEVYHLQTTTAPKPGPDKRDSTGFNFTCTENALKITMSKKELDNVKIIGLKDLLSIQEAAKSCGYNVNWEQGTLTVPFTGCFVKSELTVFSVQLLLAGGSQVRTATCPKPVPASSDLSPRARVPIQTPLNCPFLTPEAPLDQIQFNIPQQISQPGFVPPPDTLPPVQPPVLQTQNCDVPTAERLSCSSTWATVLLCRAVGCCWDPLSLSCFYPMDECTKDHHFVFSIYHNSASIPLDPASLVIPGTECRPLILTDTVAVFRFNMDECGTRSFTVGGTKIYFAVVQTAVETLGLKYGVISRSTQLRFLIECRYTSSDKTSLASTGYMVKTPGSIVPPVVYSDGLYTVELKLATDETYSSFYPTYHQPLGLLLGKPLYVQLHVVSPTPTAVLLVNYCIAYARSTPNVMVLIYDGCANPFDPHTSVIPNSVSNGPRHERRFVVKAFQFIDENTNIYLDEEIYFMCSTDVCLPLERPCDGRCFD